MPSHNVTRNVSINLTVGSGEMHEVEKKMLKGYISKKML